MADMFPDPDKVADESVFPRHLRVPCPNCDRMTLYESADTAGDVQCLSRGCRATFGRLEIDAEGPAIESRHDPVVYYMRMDRLVKIGTSTCLAARVEGLMPQGVLAIEWGGRPLERQRHQQFVADHSHREWFHLSPAIGEHVASLREAWLTTGQTTTEDWLLRHGVRV